LKLVVRIEERKNTEKCPYVPPPIHWHMTVMSKLIKVLAGLDQICGFRVLN